MRISFSTDDGRVAALDVDPTEPLENIAALLEVEFGITVEHQLIHHNGKLLNDGADSLKKSLAEFGVHEDDLLFVQRGSTQLRASRNTSRRGRSSLHAPAAKRPHIDPEVYSSLTWEDITADVAPDTLHAILQVNSGMVDLIQRRDPEMYAAATQPTPADLRKLLMKRNLSRALPEAAKAARHAQLEARLASNPFDIEAQRELESVIAQKNIEENLEMAMEHMPEAFVKVTMLYVDARINGVPVKVFVDSGAQSTILSKNCAERCGIMRLVDEKFAGRAIGVGSARIIGRVHMAPLMLGTHHFNCTFTVLDQNDVDCLLGLDMLKRFQCSIDLFHNVLRLRLGADEVSVPFLGEADIPRGIFHAAGEATEPSVASVPAPATAGSGAVDTPKPPTTAVVRPEGQSAVPASGSPPAKAQAASGGMMSPIDLSSLMPPSRGRPTSSQPPASAPAPAPAAASSRFPEASVGFLMSMGFPREKCLQALEMADGNVDSAADILPDI